MCSHMALPGVLQIQVQHVFLKKRKIKNSHPYKVQ